VPNGVYRFVVDGNHRAGGQTLPYHLVSDAFEVRPYEGIAVQGMQVEGDGSVSFTTSTAYPRTYQSSIRMIKDDGGNPICKTCTFRPWASSIDVTTVTVTVTRANGKVDKVSAHFVNGRWVAATKLKPGDRATVERGGVVDSFGEMNGVAAGVAR
jgi:hypothetical protein